jgi:hypothetical protein
MNGSTLNAQLQSLSEIYSFLNALFSHQFYYRTRELLDESSKGLSFSD